MQAQDKRAPRALTRKSRSKSTPCIPRARPQTADSMPGVNVSSLARPNTAVAKPRYMQYLTKDDGVTRKEAVSSGLWKREDALRREREMNPVGRRENAREVRTLENQLRQTQQSHADEVERLKRQMHEMQDKLLAMERARDAGAA